MYMPFIVGVGRSGTTLLRMMLSAHPDLAIPPETHFLAEILHAPEQFSDRKKFYKFITKYRTWNDFGIKKSLLKKALESRDRFTLDFGARAFYHCYALSQNKSFCGDKTPAYLGSIDRIERLLPEACFIHIIRDGRDVASSYQKVHFGSNEVTELAKLWKTGVMKGRYLAKQARCLEIRYEDLILNTESVLRKCTSFIGIEYSEEMLNYHKYSHQKLSMLKSFFSGRLKKSMVLSKEHRVHSHRLTKEKPLASRCYAWKTSMSMEDVAKFENEAKDLLIDLNYEVTT